MAEYIEREAAKKAVDYAVELNNTEYDIVCDYLDRLPAADVAPVVHGRWLDAGRGIKACSNCNHGIKEHMACVNHYCPNCGARMDGGVDDEAD